ncbi:peptidylprolyl isomerase [Phenylobacterium sp. LjRoot225]|uniref:peptidylprolyl isomerase n=1 Tax=Phenylobacterium sp. LjRoot225 TaxID=3342285 RepID=UPI003ECECE79
MTETTRRDLLALAAALAASPALAQGTGPATTSVALTTPLGRIVIALETQRAPITSANFLRYVDRKLYDGANFYRASRPQGSTADDYGLVQGGLQNDPKKVLPPIAHESTLKTGLSHVNGTISMGRHAPGTAQADWFICLGAQTYLDADAQQPGFAAFGQVTEGLEVVKQILVMPVDPTKGTGSMKGEMLKEPVPITTVRRV